ncbi:sensor histidine kinase [Streptomyces sp. TLI_146]|uniref:ATP-binding protein n=1 Tax=Streptomyces sp. TLI_146 TaxID=1938858 RepID=UPI000C70D3AC|nr:sensor histidine kinase [Streptomyces sp. TLI_146]
MDNAQRHAVTAVAVRLRAAGGQAVLTFTDDGCGVPDAEPERVFERLVRPKAPAAGTRAVPGLGPAAPATSWSGTAAR